MVNFVGSSTLNSINTKAVTCPACGLLCDDLIIARDIQDRQNNLKVIANGCAKSIAFFERPTLAASPRVAGKNTDIETAIARAVEILRAAQHLLISGLGTDVLGMRAVLSLAEKSGATMDHMNSTSSMRNLLVLQNSGWQITTLTEVRNRVDFLLIISSDIVSTFPRFFERVVWNASSMFGQDTAAREIVYLGGRDLNTQPGVAPDGRQPDVLPCDVDKLPEVIAALRALVAEKTLAVNEVAGIAVSDLQKLAARLTAAKYGVIAWSAAALDFPQAELTIQNITGLIATLNETTRCSGLPLSGSDGDVGVYNTSAWISGYPFRNSYRRGYPDYDPYHYSTEGLLADNEADALMWISSFNPERVPPASRIPTIVLGHPAMQFEHEPEVFIPLAVPGIDCTGTQFRSDSSVALPLKKLRETTLPTLADVLSSIEIRLAAKHAD